MIKVERLYTRIDNFWEWKINMIDSKVLVDNYSMSVHQNLINNLKNVKDICRILNIKYVRKLNSYEDLIKTLISKPTNQIYSISLQLVLVGHSK